MAGFLNALGLILAQSQQKIFTKAPAFWPAVSMAALCIAIDRGLPYVTKTIPSSLVGLVAATGLGIALNLPLTSLASTAPAGTFAGGLSTLPSFIDIGALGKQLITPDVLKIVVPTAISISFISIIETLLAGRVVDEMTGDPLCTFNEKGEIDCFKNSKESGPMAGYDVPTKSVLGGSVGKFISALLGGFGGCGLVPQTVLNVKSGGGGALSSAAYAISMASFVVFFAPLVGQVSMVALAGIMLTVAYDTIQWGATKDIIVASLPGKAQKTPGTRSELAALIVTFCLCYKVDMAVGIVSGILTSKGLRALGAKTAPAPAPAPAA
jgi:SulP family sulfate permease